MAKAEKKKKKNVMVEAVGQAHIQSPQARHGAIVAGAVRNSTSPTHTAYEIIGSQCCQNTDGGN